MSETVDQFRRALSRPRVRRAILVSAVLTLCFTWAMMVVGISFAMVERGAEHWWMVLVFGLVVLVVALAAGYGSAVLWRVRYPYGAAEPPADPATTVAVRPAGLDATPAPVASSPQPSCAVARMPTEPLSRRELEVLEQLAAGRSNREIAGALYLAPGTVKAHLNHIFRKLEATSRLQAVARAREAGLLDAHVEK